MGAADTLRVASFGNLTLRRHGAVLAIFPMWLNPDSPNTASRLGPPYSGLRQPPANPFICLTEALDHSKQGTGAPFGIFQEAKRAFVQILIQD